MLRAAFDATMKDAAFVVDMEKSKRVVEPMTGLEIESLLKEVYAFSPAVIATARNIIAQGAR